MIGQKTISSFFSPVSKKRSFTALNGTKEEEDAKEPVSHFSSLCSCIPRLLLITVLITINIAQNHFKYLLICPFPRRVQAAFTSRTVARRLLEVLLSASKCLLCHVACYQRVFPLWQLVFYQLCVSLNTLKSCRRNRRARRWSRSRVSRLRTHCPRSSWSGSPATREPPWRDSPPRRLLRALGRAGGVDCLLSLGSLTLNRWEHTLSLVPWEVILNTCFSCHSWWALWLRRGRNTPSTHLLSKCSPGHRCVTSEM